METQRYPITVRVVGVMHKEKSKVSAQRLLQLVHFLPLRI